MIAIQKAQYFKKQSSTIPILTRALCDPCLEVSSSTCSTLARYFKFYDDIKDYYFRGGGVYTGSCPPGCNYIREHSRVSEISHRVHAINPDLVTKADLAVIESMREPSEEWWKWKYKDEYLKAWEDYKRRKNREKKESEKSTEIEEQ